MQRVRQNGICIYIPAICCEDTKKNEIRQYDIKYKDIKGALVKKYKLMMEKS